MLNCAASTAAILRRELEWDDVSGVVREVGGEGVHRDRLIGLKVVPEAANVDFATLAPGSWLLGHVPWTEAEHRISAINATARNAESLNISKGAACLCLERRTWRAGETITYVRQIFRGDLYDLVARFSPQG